MGPIVHSEMTPSVVLRSQSSMRLTCLALSVLLASSAIASDVRLAVKRDGKKVIYNVGGAPRNTRGADLNWLAKRHDRRTKYDPLIEKDASKYRGDATLVPPVI